MVSLAARTLGGLERSYYIRNFVFALIFPAFYALMLSNLRTPPSGAALAITVAIFALNTLLYPYARFLYERLVGFIVGENVFVVGALPMLLVKALTMALCWSAALFIAPIALVYLYVYHSRSSD